MGAVSIDVNASERKYDAMFPMHTKEGVEVFLENYNHLKEMVFFSSDYDALIRIIDFDVALLNSGLSAREQIAIELVFKADLKRVDVAEMEGVTKQTVQKWLERGTEKIASYYKKEGEESGK